MRPGKVPGVRQDRRGVDLDHHRGGIDFHRAIGLHDRLVEHSPAQPGVGIEGTRQRIAGLQLDGTVQVGFDLAQVVLVGNRERKGTVRLSKAGVAVQCVPRRLLRELRHFERGTFGGITQRQESINFGERSVRPGIARIERQGFLKAADGVLETRRGEILEALPSTPVQPNGFRIPR